MAAKERMSGATPEVSRTILDFHSLRAFQILALIGQEVNLWTRRPAKEAAGGNYQD
jgi:hypothetical protein